MRAKLNKYLISNLFIGLLGVLQRTM